jgi:hypothetical protein
MGTKLYNKMPGYLKEVDNYEVLNPLMPELKSLCTTLSAKIPYWGF